jgi:hypothetical protein
MGNESMGQDPKKSGTQNPKSPKDRPQPQSGQERGRDHEQHREGQRGSSGTQTPSRPD